MNQAGLRLGIVTGLVFEADILRAAGARLEPHRQPLIACAGPGADRAQGAARNLIAQGATHLLSFGIAAALDPAVDAGAAFVASAFVRPGGVSVAGDRAWSERIAQLLPEVRLTVTADSSDILSSANAKAALRAATGAAIADMESYGTAQAAADAGLPCAALRVVSDDAAQTLPPAARAGANADGTVNIAAVLLSLLTGPGQLPALIRLGRSTGLARRRLSALADFGLARGFGAGRVDE